MVEHYSTDRTRAKRAQQIWLILIGLAHNRQTITYGGLGEMLGFGGVGVLGNFLAPIMWLCEDQKIPPLTSLVVNQDTGLPGEGLHVSPETLHAERERVFHYNWYDLMPPTPDQFATTSRNHRGG